MKLYTPSIQSDVSLIPDADKPDSEDVGLHTHNNQSLLTLFSVETTGTLRFNNQKVGGSVKNADAVLPLSESEGKLVFNGLPVDTMEHKFMNSSVLSNFSVVGDELHFNGQPVDGAVVQFANESILSGLGVDASGRLTLDGAVVDQADDSATKTEQVVYTQVAEATTVVLNHAAVESNRLTYAVDVRVSTNPDVYEPVVVGGPVSTKADVGLTYTAGSVSSVQVKNLTGASMYLRVKVQS
jgi:hypothetical protein